MEDDLLSEQSLERFFEHRMSLIIENKYPLSLSVDSDARFVLHIIQEPHALDIKELIKLENYFIPLYEQEAANIVPDFNFEGVIFSSSVHNKHAYVQVFRDGYVEAALSITNGDPRLGKIISLLTLQQNLVMRLRDYLKNIERFGVKGPHFLYFHFLNVENLKLNPNDILKSGYDPKGVNKPLMLNELTFPTYVIDNTEIAVEEFLRPFFDILWNTFGFPETPKIKGY